MTMTPKSIDVVTLEVIRSVLPAIADEMSHVLLRTSYNMMIYEVRDYCCSLLDVGGRLLAQNTGGVSHFVADLGVVIRDGVARYGAAGFEPGDVVITNHQRVAGQHLNNIVVYTPCFAAGELVAFAATRAHWIDVGGLSTGFSAVNASDPWMEGLQLDQIKLWTAGRLDDTAWRIVRDNIRHPESSLGDLTSQTAACRLAGRRIDEVVGRYGREVVERAVEIVFDQTEARCRAVVAGLPDGVYEAESLFGGHPVDDGPVVIKAIVTIAGSDLTIDLTQCSPQRRQPINARTLAAPLIAYKAITAPRDPVNEGAFRALTVRIQEGNYMMARFPAPMASWGRTLPSVVDTILSALAPILPDRIPAAHLGVLGGTVVFFGVDPETGRRFVTQSIEGGGWGGRPYEDGESASVSVCQGDVHNAPVEKMELRWPLVVNRRALRVDSGGAGRFRGGLGLDVEVEGLVAGSWTLGDTGRHRYPPWGVHGGSPGMPSDSLLRLPTETAFTQVDLVRHEVPAGATAVIVTAGGGGWGDPLERDLARVADDVREGYVSVDAARDQYGVVFTRGTLDVDVQATAARRADLARRRTAGDR
jgi:N-methylhydantoinase B